MLWSIAWKNIWRNKTRSFVVIIAVFMGMIGGIFSSAVMNGAAVQRIKDAIRLEISHIRICIPAFKQDAGLEYYFTGSDKVAEGIGAMPWCEGVSRRTRIISMANTAVRTVPVQITGIVPSADKKVFDFATCICDSCGEFLNDSSGSVVIIGDKLAENLKVKLKSKIIFTFQDKDGNITGAAFKVAGIFHTSNNLFNEFRVFVPGTVVSELVLLPEDAAHEIFVRVKDGYDVNHVKEMLKKALPGFSIESWDEIDPTMGMLNEMMAAMMYVFMVIILLALGFGIVNTMQMVVLERTRELGMLAAVGMKRGRIFSMIMLETILLTSTGALLGMAASAGLIAWTGSTGIDLTSISQGLEAAGFAAIIYPYLNPSFFAGVAVLVVLTAVVAAIIPARRATRLNPVEAIRVE
jgi:ABC-type lipoprotein release transport system permease subunit